MRRASASNSPSDVPGEMSMHGSVRPPLQKVKQPPYRETGSSVVHSPGGTVHPCPRITRCLDRWPLLVVRELLLDGRRWAELERALPGIPSNLLAERLRLLEEEGVVERATDGRVYHLTDKGRDLAPVLASLAAWGTRHCGEPSSALATHAGCGGRVMMRSSCARCGAPVPPEDLDVRGRP